jgi:hypothetical protein
LISERRAPFAGDLIGELQLGRHPAASRMGLWVVRALDKSDKLPLRPHGLARHGPSHPRFHASTLPRSPPPGTPRSAAHMHAIYAGELRVLDPTSLLSILTLRLLSTNYCVTVTIHDSWPLSRIKLLSIFITHSDRLVSIRLGPVYLTTQYSSKRPRCVLHLLQLYEAKRPG